MKRVMIITLLAISLCVLPACGATAVDNTGGDPNTANPFHEEQREESPETVEETLEATQEAGIDADGTAEPALSVESNAEGGAVPAGVNAAALNGPWHLDPYRNDLAGFPSLFDAYAEFGASMEIRSGGQLSWYIGAEGGEGSYLIEGSLLTADLTRTADNQPMTTEFDILYDGDELYLGMHSSNGIVFWSWGDEDSANFSGEAALQVPGENVVELVNLRGDETTVYKLDDGRYMDRTNTIFTFDGIDTWTDEGGAEWSRIIR